MEELEAITPLTADRTRALQLTPWEMIEAGLLFIGNDNTIILPPSTSEGPRRQVIEDNSTTIKNSLSTLQQLWNTTILESLADGSTSGKNTRWTAFVPVTVTADGTGIPPATVIVPLVAALRLDVAIWMVNDDASGVGQYKHNFRTDPLAAVGGITPVLPPWTAVIIPAPAAGSSPPNTYGHRMLTDTIASAFGIADGAAADWPNAASVTFFGFFRAVP